MEGNGTNGPLKRPRTDNFVDLTEDNGVRNRVRELEEENKRMKKVEEENKELREALEELRGMVECPVCLLVPRQQGPLPVCSNGHFVCHTCRDRIRQEALVGEPKCPSCMVALGNATSLLASRVIEKLKHECEHDGCLYMIPFADLKKHQLVCLFRKVLCPGRGFCTHEISFNKLDEHFRVCDDIDKSISETKMSWQQQIPKIVAETDAFIGWTTDVIKSGGKTFFSRCKRQNFSHFFEVLMLGSEAECKEFLACVTILDGEGQVFTRKEWRPRPISLEEWGLMGLVVPEKALSSIWRADEEQNFVYDLEMSVKKVEK